MNLRQVYQWIQDHPARFGTIAGWYQQFCGLLMTAFTAPLILNADVLSAEHSSIWFAFQSTLAVVNLTDFGLSQVISRQVAFSLARSSGGHQGGEDFLHTSPGWAGVAEVFCAARKVFRWLNLVATALIVGSYELILPLGRLIENRTATITIAWYLLGAATVAALQSRFYQGVLDGLGRLYLGRLISGTGQLVTGLLVILALQYNPNLAVMATVVLAVGVMQMVVFRWVLLRVSEHRLQSEKGNYVIPLRLFWKVAMPMGVVNSSAFLVSSVQVPIIGSIMGPAAVTPYYLAQRIAQVAILALLQFVAPQVPLFTQQIAANQSQPAARRMQKTLWLVSGSSLVAFGLYYLLSPVVVDTWVGKGHYVDRAILLVLAADGVLMTVGVCCTHFVLASGRNPFQITTLVSGVLNLVGCFTLPRTFGLMGIAMSGLLAGLATNYWFTTWQGFKLLQRVRKSSIENAARGMKRPPQES